MWGILNKTKIRAINKMRLKHNLRPEASKMNIVPNLHSMLISIPKMVDVDYIAMFDKKKPGYTTLQLPSCQQQKTLSLMHHAARTQDCGNSTPGL
jgi:hypothetical protein